MVDEIVDSQEAILTGHGQMGGVWREGNGGDRAMSNGPAIHERELVFGLTDVYSSVFDCLVCREGWQCC